MERGAGKGEGKGMERLGKEERTYSKRVAVIEGNFIILRHYPRYCNAIKLDTLRTPRKTAGISLNILCSSEPLASTSYRRGNKLGCVGNLSSRRGTILNFTLMNSDLLSRS